MASTDTPKTVILKAPNEPLHIEGTAATATISPGHLIQGIQNGTLSLHDNEGELVVPMIAREHDYIGGDINTAYALGERVSGVILQRGDEAYMWLDAGNDVAVNEKLQSAGTGGLEALTTSPGNAIAEALEAVDNDPGVGGAQARIKVRVL